MENLEDQQRPALHRQQRAASDRAVPGQTPGDDRSSRPRLSIQELSQRLAPWLTHVSRLADRRTLTRRRLITAAVIAGLLAFVFGLRLSAPSVPASTSPDTHLFSVSGQPTLIFQHFIGNVNIAPGPGGQVSIKEMKNGETDEILIHYAQQGDTLTATVDVPGGLMEDTWVDFDVTVPERTGLTASVPTGTLEASGLSGPITLSNTNGAIWATNLTGSIGLRTQSGSINLSGVSGRVTVVTQNGTVTTSATRLEDRSSIQAESGTINFHGTLGRTGTYVFQNTNGAVGISLPPSSAFTLIAHTRGGAINSDFQGVKVTQVNGHTDARGAVGTSARAQLIVQTSGGSVDLHRGG